MARTRREPPLFDGPEPEDDASWGLERAGNGAFEADRDDDLPMGSLGDYELEARDSALQPDLDATPPEPAKRRLRRVADAQDESVRGGQRRRPASSLATRAARAAFRAGSAAAGIPAVNGNGRQPASSGPAAAAAASVTEAHELMDTLARAAAGTEDEVAALGLVAAIVPVALGLAPNAYRALWPAIPALVRGTMGVARLLHAEPTTRPRLSLLPAILARTTARLAQHAARGSALHPQLVARVLAENTAAALSRLPAASARTPRARATGSPAHVGVNGRTRVEG